MMLFPNKQKAIDLAMWQNHNHRFDDDYAVMPSSNGDYLVIQTEDPSFDSNAFESLPTDYKKMDYGHIAQIRTDYDPLPHWEEIAGMFSTVHGETLRFILNTNIPLKKFIRYELSCRGYDENFQWVGFDKAEDIWLK